MFRRQKADRPTVFEAGDRSKDGMPILAIARTYGSIEKLDVRKLQAIFEERLQCDEQDAQQSAMPLPAVLMAEYLSNKPIWGDLMQAGTA
jgi:hypothetical protein